MESAVRSLGPSCMSTETLSDASLLQHYRSGSIRAFDVLFERHWKSVCGIVYRLVGDEADDVVQEAFLRLYRRPPRITTGSLGPWLYRVATNLALNSLRGRRRWQGYRDALGQSTEGQGWRPAVVDPQREMERDEERLAVRSALSRLNRRQASVLALRYGGLSYREVAQVLRVSPGSVGTLLARAERAFARVYEDIAGEESGGGE